MSNINVTPLVYGVTTWNRGETRGPANLTFFYALAVAEAKAKSEEWGVLAYVIEWRVGIPGCKNIADFKDGQQVIVNKDTRPRNKIVEQAI